MKHLNDYMALPYRMEIIPDLEEGGFTVSWPELPGCLSCGETMEEAVRNGLDAKITWLESALEDGLEIPVPANLDDYSGQFKLRLPKSLHRDLSEQARAEGISMNQYCLYLLAMNNAKHVAAFK